MSDTEEGVEAAFAVLSGSVRTGFSQSHTCTMTSAASPLTVLTTSQTLTEQPGHVETDKKTSGDEETKSCPVSSSTSASSSRASTGKSSRQTVRRACAPCAKAKRRCDPIRPCKRCIEKGITSQCQDRFTKVEARRQLAQERIRASLDTGAWPPLCDQEAKRQKLSLVDGAIAMDELREQHLGKDFGFLSAAQERTATRPMVEPLTLSTGSPPTVPVPSTCNSVPMGSLPFSHNLDFPQNVNTSTLTSQTTGRFSDIPLSLESQVESHTSAVATNMSRDLEEHDLEALLPDVSRDIPVSADHMSLPPLDDIHWVLDIEENENHEDGTW